MVLQNHALVIYSSYYRIPKTHILQLRSQSHRKILKVLAFKFMFVDMFSKILGFTLKIAFYHCQQITSVIFLEETGSLC